MVTPLPSLTALRSFEAAARHLSFKTAAGDLGVTPTAVSHQIRELEGQLGQRLFERMTRRVALTPVGHRLYEDLARAFAIMRAAVETCRTTEARATATLGLGPLVATKWLSPRLSRFWRDCSDIDLRLHHSPLELDFRNNDIDLAIAWGNGRWPGLISEMLLQIRTTPVASPRLFPGDRAVRPQDLEAWPLLHQRDHAGWRAWFAAAGLPAAKVAHGIVIEDAHVVHQAAIEGQGVALGNLPLINDDLAAGRLVAPFDLAVASKRAYYLTYPAETLERPHLRQVRDWLLREAGTERKAPS